MYREVPDSCTDLQETEPVSGHPHLAQRWDCYGTEFSTLLLQKYLYGLDCEERDVAIPRNYEERSYLFTAVPIGDAYLGISR